MKYPKSFEELLECFKTLPGIGEKNAERLCFAVLQSSEEQAKKFSDSIMNVKTKIKKCNICNNYTEDSDICEICNNEGRDHSTICVVESVKDLILFEKSNAFKGVYHVLHGSISPMNGIGPDDIKIKELLARITPNTKEVILATNPRVEGEATAMYISKLLKPLGVTASRIAHGIPIGGDLEYTDEITLSKALEGRREL